MPPLRGNWTILKGDEAHHCVLRIRWYDRANEQLVFLAQDHRLLLRAGCGGHHTSIFGVLCYWDAKNGMCWIYPSGCNSWDIFCLKHVICLTGDNWWFSEPASWGPGGGGRSNWMCKGKFRIWRNIFFKTQQTLTLTKQKLTTRWWF